MKSKPPKLTLFQQSVLRVIDASLNKMANSWDIAYALRAHVWERKRQAHAGWVAAVDRAGMRLVALGLVVRIPPETQRDFPLWSRVGKEMQCHDTKSS